MSEYPLETGDDIAEDAGDYRRLSLWSGAALLLGLASPLALIGPPLWSVPILGLIAAAVGLREIEQADHSVIGRKGALWGLGLCVIFAVAGPVQIVVARMILAHQAQPMANAFLDFLRQDEPQKALQFFEAPNHRRPLDGALKGYYRQSENIAEFKKFVALPAVRGMLALGPQAEARLVDYFDIVNTEFNDYVTLRYAITYEDHGKKTFFVGFRMERSHSYEDPKEQWKITSFAPAPSPF